MKILVTGGAGFIASQVADALLGQGHEVFVIDDLSSGKEINVNPRVGFYRINICDENVHRIFAAQRFDVLCHHAAQIDVRASVADPSTDVDTNVKGLINLMEAGRKNGLKKVIFASTGGALYGEPLHVPQDELHPKQPASPYGINKYIGEHYLNFYQQTYGISYVALRYANVYGPRQNPHGEAGVIAIFIKHLLADKQPRIYGDGQQTRDFVCVEDVVRANLKALAYTGSGEFNIGTGQESSINEVYETLADLIGVPKSAIREPGKPGEQRRSVLDIRHAKKELGWVPRVPLLNGLAKTVDWFQKQLVVQS